ncbi:chitooligosaccharidolytic beta-N-acetylglucosaminidase-like isoform X2 [Macrobrachium rosenbergii]|uniref:chitooligosaccharidolytic beta-N-acetylglucosaminidase-like isoform X2 n=1 Tax=Macrobrachium rosenbergii TaxID=79674 RepID=UPI0034D4B8DA
MADSRDVKNQILFSLLFTASLLHSALSDFPFLSPYSWSCVNETCVKNLKGWNEEDAYSLSTCKLTCGQHGVLWPKPTRLTQISNQTVHFNLSRLSLEEAMAPTQEVKDLLQKAFDIFKGNVAKGVPEPDERFFRKIFDSDEEKQQVFVKIRVSNTGKATTLRLNTNEAYVLNVKTNETNSLTNVTIDASTFFGARHALETLSQLIEYDAAKGSLQIVSQVAVVDKPAFRYRGILLDTASNFISVRAIERTLDAMAANKLNTLHWHITDTASFPLYLKSLPDMSYFGSYSQRQIYNTSDVSHVVEYARVRGIRVVPEFSAPGHVGNGWQWTEKKGLGKMAVCVKQEPWSTYCTEPPCGQLNIANNNTYGILTQIYEEMADIFAPLDLFHFGGQEVNLNCWNTTEEIVSHLTERGLNQSVDSFLDLWSEFQSNVYNMFPADNQTGKVQGILWNSQLTSAEKADKYLDPRKYIIQASGSVKDQRVIGDLLKKGYHVILSNSDAWFLNCGFGSWVTKGQHPCGSYKGWQAVYDNSPHDVASNETGSYQKKLLLGGEAVLWSQQVDDASLDAKLWPRGAALAERLWTNPKHNWEPAEIRFIHQRQRLFQRGVMADRIQPEWCHQNEKLCYLR